MPRISAIVITYNEEKNIQRCLESLSWADEIVVVDSFSQDRTKDIASSFTDKIFDLGWQGFGKQKEIARTKASYDWVLSVDADEVVSEKLKEEIKSVINKNDSLDGYYIPRLSNFLGRWIKHSGWYPDYVLRLFRKDKARFDDSPVHEKLILDGKAGFLRNEIRHYTDPDISHYLSKMDKYTTLSAQKLLAEGKSATLFDLLLRPVAIFFKMYLFKSGFLDGWQGFLLACFSSFHVFVKYAKLWHLRKSLPS
ncbi:MAG: glycosyltransferase family 2 protein [candidate division Zixibacteria bacterium]|nr:glycosyltransferase family 2 protein [candidate division Zixibacteria bacterium]